ncbi:MAG: two-component regulator propeller domain-containing protein [Bacteroidota bacterium]
MFWQLLLNELSAFYYIARMDRRIALIKITLVSLLLYCAAQMSGQDPYFVNYNTKDGLPGIEVYDIEVDHQGIIWLTTDRGLASYNGYEFTNYTQADGLTNNTLFKIFKDAQQCLWFTTLNGGLCYYDRGTFHPYEGNAVLQAFTNGLLIHRLVITEEEQIYFCLSNQKQTIFTLEQHGKEVQAVPFEQLAQQNKRVEVDGFQILELNGMLMPSPQFISDFLGVFTPNDPVFTPHSERFRYLGEVYAHGISKEHGLLHSHHLGSRVLVDHLYVDIWGDLWICTGKPHRTF